MENEKEKFIMNFRESLEKFTFLKINLGKYRGDDKEFQNILVRKIIVKDEEKLSFTFRYKTKDIVKNYDAKAGINLLDEILGKDFLSATLFTTDRDVTLDYSKKRIPQLYLKKPTKTSKETTGHNEIKSRFVNKDAKYFRLLGITTSDGRVKADKYDKFRQVDKFIEIVDSLYKSSDLVDKHEIKIFDMGSGKSYMTFAMYDYFSKLDGKNISITGIEQREDLVNLSNKIAEECEFTGLRFRKGTIENLTEKKVDIVVALHACDIATDDAINKSVIAGSQIIVLAPCCHKYVRKKMKSPEELKGIFKHGILEERLAISITDGLRVLTMEHFGYDTKVFEFISTEHTAKNTMITATKTKPVSAGKLNEIDSIKKNFQIEDFYLDLKLLS